MKESRIDVLGEKAFAFRDDAHHIVTFLNKTLKYRNLIFGLSLNDDQSYNLRIYEVVDTEPETKTPEGS